jgi:hypothetical protein
MMDEVLKNLTIGFLAYVIVNNGLWQRARHDAAQQAREAFNATGTIRASVSARGIFGYFASDLWSVDIYGQNQQADHLPIYVYPRGGWKGRIRHLRLHLTALMLSGLPVERFEADIPFAKYDLGWAVWKDRLLLRGAAVGTAEVQVGAAGLQAFVLRKYHKILSDIEVTFPNKKLSLSGHLAVFGVPTPFSATGLLAAREGRYIDLIDPEIRLNGVRLSPQNTAVVLSQINPVLDADEDFHLGGAFVISDLQIGDAAVLIRGSLTVPTAPPGLKPH